MGNTEQIFWPSTYSRYCYYRGNLNGELLFLQLLFKFSSWFLADSIRLKESWQAKPVHFLNIAQNLKSWNVPKTWKCCILIMYKCILQNSLMLILFHDGIIFSFQQSIYFQLVLIPQENGDDTDRQNKLFPLFKVLYYVIGQLFQLRGLYIKMDNCVCSVILDFWSRWKAMIKKQ